MPLDPLNLALLSDAQGRFRHDFNEFAEVWRDAKEQWRDERASRFEKEYLAPLGPSLSRFAAALGEFMDTVRQAQVAIDDPGQIDDGHAPRELY